MSLPGLGGAAHNGGIPSSSRPTTTGMRPRQQQSMFPEAETGSARRTRSKVCQIHVAMAVDFVVMEMTMIMMMITMMAVPSECHWHCTLHKYNSR